MKIGYMTNAFGPLVGAGGGVTSVNSPSGEGLTAYRYGSTHVLIITVRVGICNSKVCRFSNREKYRKIVRT